MTKHGKNEVETLINKLNGHVISDEDCNKYELNKMYVDGYNKAINTIIQELQNMDNESKY